MGVCLINDNFEELKLDYYEKQKAEEEKSSMAKKKYINTQQIITVNKFQLERIKKQKLLKKKTHDNNNLNIQKNEEILLLSSKKEKDKAKTEFTNLNESKFISATLRSKKYDIINYPQDVFKLINTIRNNPESFVKDIEAAILNIQKYKNKLIYNGNIKIYLNKGEKMFNEAIEDLKKAKSMNSLTFNKEIGIEMPTEEEYQKDRDFFKKKILEKKKN